MRIATPLTIVVAAAPAAILVDAYYVGGCRPFRATSRFSSPEERTKYFRKQQERMNRAYKELQEDLEQQAQRAGQQASGGGVGYGAENSRPSTFRMDDDEALRKQREWVGRAFDLASEFNSDFAPTQEEAEKNNEFIRKSREWIDRMYGVDIPQAEKSRASVAFKPRYEVRSTKDKFEVALDVPGVAREDIDISLENEGKVLMIKGEREVFGTKDDDELQKVRFSQKFDLDDNVDTDKISARLDKGVLEVFAPKKMVEEEEDVRKSIPIM